MSRLGARDGGREINILQVEERSPEDQWYFRVVITSLVHLLARSGVVNQVGFLTPISRIM